MASSPSSSCCAIANADGPRTCMCPIHKLKPFRPLTELMLDCWQREYDKRPYRKLILNGRHYRKILNRNMNENDFGVLINFLKTRAQITSLAIAYMDIPRNPVQSRKFFDNISRLQQLSLIAVCITSKMLEFLAQSECTSNLRVLQLTGNKLSLERATRLQEFLRHSSSLEYLDVSNCSLNEYSLPMIADGIQKCKTLKAIDLSRIVNRTTESCLDENKVGSLAGILLGTCQQLEEIHLNQCGLDSKAIELICEYLARSKTLLYLDLSSNKIAGEGVETLFLAICKGNRLVGLDLSGNRIGEYGGISIAHLLPKTRLQYLNISRNGIPAKEVNFILLTIKKKFPIRALHIGGNQFSSEVAKTLHRQLAAKIFENIDVSITYDSDEGLWRVVPCDACSVWNKHHKNRDGIFFSPFFIQNYKKLQTLSH